MIDLDVKSKYYFKDLEEIRKKRKLDEKYFSVGLS